MLYVSFPITAALFALALVLGAVMGSFLNCAAWRLVHRESVLRGRSHCTACGHTLGAMDLIPVISYLALKGKCRYCGGHISLRYPVSELICAAAYGTVLLRYDVTWACLRYLILLSALLLGALVDLEDGWIPDRISVTAAACYVPLALLEGGGKLLLSGVIGALAISLPMLLIVALVEKHLKTEAMGGGDLKLFAVLGLFFGWQQGLFLVLVSCVLGLAGMAVSGRLARRTQTPFAPALYLSAWLTALFGEKVIRWYLGLF